MEMATYDPERALMVWQTLRLVGDGLGGGNEIVGGWCNELDSAGVVCCGLWAEPDCLVLVADGVFVSFKEGA